MGWSSTYKPRGQTLKDSFKDEFAWRDHPEAGLVDICSAGWNLAYAAVRHPRGHVFAAVIQIRYSRGYYNFTYRVDDESVGPVHATCPQRILDLLTPDEEMIAKHGEKPDGYWREWRERSRAHHAAKQARPKIRDGDIIRFENPIAFQNGLTLDTFVVRRRKTYRGGTSTSLHGTSQDAQGHIREGYGNYKVPRWRERAHRVIGHAPRA